MDYTSWARTAVTVSGGIAKATLMLPGPAGEQMRYYARHLLKNRFVKGNIRTKFEWIVFSVIAVSDRAVEALA